MINFFSKVRKKTLTENKFSKYILYAIGEIVLVMIGILLALQVNNWNENRKQVSKQNAIFLIVKNDLQNDITAFEIFIVEYKTIRKPSFLAVLNPEFTREDWNNNPGFSDVLRGYKDMGISQRGVSLLKNASGLSDNLEQKLIPDINLFYDTHSVEINITITEMANQFERNYVHFQNYNWFASFLLHDNADGLMDSLNSDPTLKNRIAIYYTVFNIYVTELQNYVTNAKLLVIAIDDYLK